MEIRNDGISIIAVCEADDDDGPSVEMLWVPNAEKSAHQHISFTLEEARSLYEFLQRFLADNRDRSLPSKD